MTAHSPTVVVEFCKLCDWAYECWIVRRGLFEDNVSADALMNSKHGDFFHRLNTLTQEYVLHQIAKLHDPAIQSGKVNLTVDYIVDYGGWDAPTSTILQNLRNTLKDFAEKLAPARNKILAHNDLASILSGVPLGKFPKDADVEYFRTLQEFVNVVHDRVVGGPFHFNDLAKSDAALMLSSLKS